MAPIAQKLHIDVNTNQSNLINRIGLVCLVFLSSMALGLAPIILAASFPNMVSDNVTATNPHSVLNQ